MLSRPFVQVARARGPAKLDPGLMGGRTRSGRISVVHVLVVEDDPSWRAVAAELLQDEGYDVSTAEHGGEALAILHASPPPDLIVVDLDMPVMDGWTLIAALQADPELARIPVLVVSARLEPCVCGSVRHLPKPVDADEFLEAVACDARSTERQSVRAVGRERAGPVR